MTRNELADQHSVGGAGRSTRGVLEQLRATMPSLTSAELKVARRLLNREPTAGLGSTSALAAAAGVSGPTVTRFVKKLGFEDYGAFQKALRRDLDARMVSPVDTLRDGVPGTSSGLLAYGERLSSLLQATMAAIPEHEFESTCQLLASVKQPVLVSGGLTSAVAARHLAGQLQQIRGSVHPVIDPVADMTAVLADRGPKVNVVLFDVRRYEQRTIAMVERLRAGGAKVVLVTDVWMSPASRQADIVLPVAVDADLVFDSLIGAMAIAEAITDRTAQLLGDRAVARIRSYNALSVAFAPRWEPEL